MKLIGCVRVAASCTMLLQERKVELMAEAVGASVGRGVRTEERRFLSAQNVLICCGLAALWLCLQSSGYYPLSVSDPSGEGEPKIVAAYHFIYGVLLVALAGIAVGLRQWLKRERIGFGFVLAGAAAGVVGHGLLILCPVGGSWAILALGTALVAAFVVVMVLYWGCTLASHGITQVLFLLPVSFLCAEAITMLATLALVPHEVLVATSALALAASTVIYEKEFPDDVVRGLNQQGSLRGVIPWGMVMPVLLLIYFCEIFIRLSTGAFTGTASLDRQFVTAAMAFATFMVVFACLRFSRSADADKVLIAVFSLLMLVYFVALIAMLLFDEQGRYFTNRILVACSHCNEVFLWMVLLSALKKTQASPLVAFVGLVVFALAVPWALSFDVYYLLGLDTFFETRDILVHGVALALMVVAAGTIGFLLLYAFRAEVRSEDKGAVSTAAGGATPEEMVEEVLAPFGLTPRENEVAGYLARGYSARKIAEALFLSEASIRAHTMHIYRKMDIHSKQEFISYIDEKRRQ